jgi:hypothetical protein
MQNDAEMEETLFCLDVRHAARSGVDRVEVLHQISEREFVGFVYELHFA